MGASKPSASQDWGLYIGGIREAEDLESLRNHGITAVVNAASDVVHAACLREEPHVSVVFSKFSSVETNDRRSHWHDTSVTAVGRRNLPGWTEYQYALRSPIPRAG